MRSAAHGLRVEHLEEPLGIHTPAPRLSWRLPDGAREQLRYRLSGDNGLATGWIDSAQSLLIPYDGPVLGSAQRVQWQVQVTTDLGASDWSDPCWFETGLLWSEDWQSSWIEPGVDPAGTAGARPAALLRAEFDVERPVLSARLYCTAQGLYEAFLNSERVGDAELTPGFTQYDAQLQVQTFDVTASLVQGRNAIAVVLSDGWFRGQVGMVRTSDQWGNRLALLAQLQLRHDDGSVTVLGTGPFWRSAVAHVLVADLVAGQQVDLRRVPNGWQTAGFDDSAWDCVSTVEHGFAGLVDSPAPPVRRVDELIPVSVRRLDADRQIVDLGQNINGWLRLSALGPAGTAITLTHGEWLGADGDVSTDHLRPDVPFLPHPLPAGQVDFVVSAGIAGETFEPRHTTHGFQYVRITGAPELTTRDVRGIVVHTDLRRTGWFSGSDDRINRLHEAAVWSLRGNVCDIPTDCPHRERAGWTADWQVFVPTAAFLYDVAGFSTKWLRDVAADQWPDGTIANISPSARAEGRDGPVALLNGSAGWGDAAVIVPWELYRAYGDTRILEELWPTMVGWLDRAERIARTQRHPGRVARRPEPAPHEKYLWDGGFHWGEWLEPGGGPGTDFGSFVAADKGDVATAYFAHSAGLMARIAGVLGRYDDAVRYAALADHVRAAWQAEYVGADGRLTPDTQANLVRALAFDLVPDEFRGAVADRLVELIRAAGTHLGTGFLATPYLLPVLADAGHLDVAYELLLQDTEPSWLVMIDRGANTMWERWNGVNTDGVPYESLNHYSKGAVISFLHRYTAGIELLDDEPAYRRFRIRPRPGGGLTSASAAHESPYGRIESAWEITADVFALRIMVPAGTTAEVVLPDGRTEITGPGAHHFRADLTVNQPKAIAR